MWDGGSNNGILIIVTTCSWWQMLEWPLLPWLHHHPAPSNADLCCLRGIVALLWLCDCPDLGPRLQLGPVELGMIPQCPASPCFRELIGLSRRIILSIKVHVKLRHTCNPHAVGAVSVPRTCMSTAHSPLAAFTVDPLPAGYQYAGPLVLDGDDLCKCNTVTYSLLCACGACQEDLWIRYKFIISRYIPLDESTISWSEWVTNCTKVLAPST